jgi:hypothetical protein
LIFVALVLQSLVAGFGIDHYKTEQGPFERGAVAAMGIALAAFLILAPRVALGRGWHISVLLALLVGRELDFDKRFTDKGILQLRLYTGDYPIAQQILGAAVILLVLIALWRCLRPGLRPFLSGVLDRQPWTLWLGGGVVLVVIAKTLDGIGRKLAPLGIDVTAETGSLASLAEEGLELVFALMLVLAVCTWVRDHRRNGS